jgi:hypothetical protein
MSPLVAAALAGNCAVTQRLLAASATAEAVDAQGRTALAAAATGSGQLLGLLKITIYSGFSHRKW